jgi:hypothetical protein
MTLAYLVVAAVGLPVVLYGQRTDRTGRTGSDRFTALVRGAGAAAFFGGLTGFALSLLAVHAAVVAVAATLIAAGAAYLRVWIVVAMSDDAARLASPEEEAR